MFWILVGDSGDKTLLLIVVMQCLHGIKDFSGCTVIKNARGVKEDGGVRIRKADSNWPKKYPIPYGITLNNGVE